MQYAVVCFGLDFSLSTLMFFFLLCSFASLLMCIFRFSFASVNLFRFCFFAFLLFDVSASLFLSPLLFCLSVFLLLCFSASCFAFYVFSFCFACLISFPCWLRRLFVFLHFSAFWLSFIFPVLLLYPKYI